MISTRALRTTRGPLAAALLASSCLTTTGLAQSPIPNLLFVGSDANGGSTWQQDGRPGATVMAAGPVRLAPDGAPWARSLFAGAQATVVSFFPRPISGQFRIRYSAQNLSGAVVAVTVTARSTGLVVTDGNRMLELDAVAQTTVNSWNLAGPPTALEVDDANRAWIGIDNQPTPLVQVVDLASGRSNILTLSGAAGPATCLVPDGRAGGSHVLVGCENTASVFEFDSRFQLVDQHPIAGLPTGAGVDELTLAPDGSILTLSRGHGIWRVDPVRGTSEPLLAEPLVETIGFDAHGVLWLATERTLFSYDLVSGTPDAGRAIPSAPFGAGVPRMQDPAGLHIARVLDRTGDLDGDGNRNRDEVLRRSNPFDPASNLHLDLAARLDVPGHSEARLTLRGDLGVGVVAFGTARLQTPITLPGVLGGFELDPRFILAAPIQTLVPGTLRIPVPDLAAEVRLMAQAFGLPVAGPQRFSDLVPINLRPVVPLRITESFQNGTNRDQAASSGSWGNGALVPSDLGGRGLLGAFDPTLGTPDGPNRWVFSTDDQLFPASATLFGQAVRITDGVFEFESMHVPAGVTVAFRGSNPAVIRVRGDVRIDGTLEVDGVDQSDEFDGSSVFDGNAWVPVNGEPGSSGGAAGGHGGDGGRGADGNGTPGPSTGRNGDPIQVPAGSGYATAGGLVATAGQGALLFPLDGNDASVTFNLFATVCLQTGAGGSGGAFLGAGGDGVAIRNAAGLSTDLGPTAPGGTPMPFLAVPPRATSLEHFLIGGAGGGGGGSHPLGLSRQQLQFDDRAWHAGAGGAGGGGALALRVGDDLVVSGNGAIRAIGGSAGTQTTRGRASAPGGGGSGGSVLLQLTANGIVNQMGEIDVSGGAGGLTRYVDFNGQTNETTGGDGGHGLVRLEAPQSPSPTALGVVRGPTTIGSDNVGVRTDRDPWSGARSKFYGAQTLGTPRWNRYVVTAVVGGAPVTFSDDPTAGSFPNVPGQPLGFYVQGGRLDPVTGEVQVAGPLRQTMAELDSDHATHVRFLILFDRSVTHPIRISSVSFDLGR